jgi:hypothetical protein
MLQIVIAFGAASPIVLEHRFVRTLRYWVATLSRLTLAFAGATLAYFGVLLALTQTYSLHQPHSVMLYGFGFTLATLAGVIAGALISPARLSRIVIQGASTLAAAFPAGLYLHFGLAGDWSPLYLLYLIGSIVGSCAIGQLMSWSRAHPRLCGV